MSDMERWQRANDAYLSAALAWLRLRLARLARLERAVPAPVGNGDVPTNEHSGATVQIADAEVEEAAAAMEAAAERTDPPPAAILLSRRFGLSRFEREILLLCAGLELDTRIAGLCARAQDDPNRPHPTFALAMALFDEPTWDALSPGRPLRHWQLIEINQPGAQPLTASALRADERIVSYLKGLNYLDDRLMPLLVPFENADGAGELPPSQEAVAATAVRHLETTVAAERPPVLQLVGADRLSQQLAAQRVAAQLGLLLYRLPVEMLPTQAAELETLARLWERESILLPVALYLDAHGADGAVAESGQTPPLQRFLIRSSGLVFLGTRDLRADLGRPHVSLDVARPTAAEQQAAWRAALGNGADVAPARLAGQFDLNQTTIRQITDTVLATDAEDEAAARERLWETCRIRTRPQLAQLAQRLDAKATWDEIVLPDEQMDLLRQIAAQVGQRARVYDAWGFRRKMNRGLGISALFAGPSGTGKTMAAEVLANDLRLDLYRIDLSGVVSKYIGETEKNLRKLFDAAEDGGAILFFDEADALFGKRSEVKDSHDRYANIEINYLLQRMEAYRGLAVLATNRKNALDQAFMRRLRFIVDFPFPGVEERRRIWQRVFPPETPVDGLDHGRLARLNLTGGSIHNVALNGAFLAAQANQPVTMPLVLQAARTEFRKLERPVNEAELRWTSEQ
jgi:hypothetical protein